MKSITSIKHLALITICSLLIIQANAQYATIFNFSETAPEQVLQIMEKNANSLFSEIYKKYNQNDSQLYLPLSVVTKSAKEKIDTMWKCSHFYCTEPNLNLSVMKRSFTETYEVRNIPLCYCEGDDEYKCKFIVLEFDRYGKISNLSLTLPKHDISTIITKGRIVTNEKEREDIQIIEDFIDIFFDAYNCKNIALLEKMYSEEALIITGKVVDYKTHSNNEFSRTLTNNTKIEYSIQSKKEYLQKLKGIFVRNDFINIRFDGVEIIQSAENPNRYGVRLNQYWHVSKKANIPGYYDEGKLFLIIDLTDQDNPEIWVRTWQPFRDNWGNPITYSNKDFFKMGDFIFE